MSKDSMPEQRVLTEKQLDTLRRELGRDDLAIYTVVRLAREDVSVGHFDAAVARLKVDADKIRMHSKPLCDLIMSQYN